MKWTQLSANELHAVACAGADHYESAILMKRDVAITNNVAAFYWTRIKHICVEFEHRFIAKPKLRATSNANFSGDMCLTQIGEVLGIDMADDGLPADARMCPLFHVVTVEPLSTDARAG